ncbi:MAG: glycosyltransferase WbuB [Candidatus Electrothrix sp. AR1]|nr:glycosyltransferase WbuB [Candidatus Electrothrix sp. AR1]
MNIACFSHYFTPEIGAPSARFHDMSRQWLSEGHSVDIITCFPNHPKGRVYPGYTQKRYQHEQIDGINVHRNWTYLATNTGFLKKTLGHFSLWPSAHFNSEKYLNKLDVTVGTSPTFFAAMAASGAARRRDIPFVMDVRDLWPAVFVELGVVKSRGVIRLLEKWELSLYRQATRIVTVTESFRSNLINRGVPASKVHTIPNGADTDYWLPKHGSSRLRNSLNLQDKFIALYIGAHGIAHALGRIIEAADRIQHIKDIHFLFVGAGAEKSMLIQQAKSLNLQNVTFHDSVPKEKVADFYAMSDVCLVPLRDIPLFETFIPSKMFEIMSIERPIIGSVRGEAADILNRSKAAVVVPPEDSKAIADAVCTLRNNPNRRHVMGQNGRIFVKEHYSRKALAAKYIEVMREAIEEYKAK